MASMLRGADRAQAGSQRLHGQADFGAKSESETFEASSFKGNQTAQSRRRGSFRLQSTVPLIITVPPLENGVVIISGKVCWNWGMNDLTGNASDERAFMDEKQLLAKLPISRRTLGNWKATGVLPYIKIGRRCLYDWASVQGALLRRQRGGQ